MAYKFPEAIQAEGHTWRLTYDPSNPSTVMPDLRTPKVQNVSGQWVEVAGQNGPERLYMVVVDLLYPAVTQPNYMKPAQFVRGFRLYPSEMNPERVPPQEMAMYVREVQQAGSSAQEFLNAILGVSLMEKDSGINTNWANEVLQPVSPPKEKPAPKEDGK